MATFAHDKKVTDSEILLLLDDVLCKEDYPNPDNIDLVDVKEYDRATRQVFLWVSTLFTNEEWDYIEKYMIENLHRRTKVAICRYNRYFGLDNDEFENSD